MYKQFPQRNNASGSHFKSFKPSHVGAALLASAILTLVACGGGGDEKKPGNAGTTTPQTPTGPTSPSAPTPSSPVYTVAGTVTGLDGSLVLQNNAGDDLSVNANGSFNFSTTLAAGASYNITVKTAPTSPKQSCTVSNGSGTVAAANVGNVAVQCIFPQLAYVGLGSTNATPGLAAYPMDDDGTLYPGHGAFISLAGGVDSVLVDTSNRLLFAAEADKIHMFAIASDGLLNGPTATKTLLNGSPGPFNLTPIPDGFMASRIAGSQAYTGFFTTTGKLLVSNSSNGVFTNKYVMAPAQQQRAYYYLRDTDLYFQLESGGYARVDVGSFNPTQIWLNPARNELYTNTVGGTLWNLALYASTGSAGTPGAPVDPGLNLDPTNYPIPFKPANLGSFASKINSLLFSADGNSMYSLVQTSGSWYARSNALLSASGAVDTGSTTQQAVRSSFDPRGMVLSPSGNRLFVITQEGIDTKSISSSGALSDLASSALPGVTSIGLLN